MQADPLWCQLAFSTAAAHMAAGDAAAAMKALELVLTTVPACEAFGHLVQLQVRFPRS